MLCPGTMLDGVRRSERGRGGGRAPPVARACAALQRGRRVPARQHAAVGPAAGRRHCESYDDLVTYSLILLHLCYYK